MKACVISVTLIKDNSKSERKGKEQKEKHIFSIVCLQP